MCKCSACVTEDYCSVDVQNVFIKTWHSSKRALSNHPASSLPPADVALAMPVRCHAMLTAWPPSGPPASCWCIMVTGRLAEQEAIGKGAVWMYLLSLQASGPGAPHCGPSALHTRCGGVYGPVQWCVCWGHMYGGIVVYTLPVHKVLSLGYVGFLLKDCANFQWAMACTRLEEGYK